MLRHARLFASISICTELCRLELYYVDLKKTKQPTTTKECLVSLEANWCGILFGLGRAPPTPTLTLTRTPTHTYTQHLWGIDIDSQSFIMCILSSPLPDDVFNVWQYMFLNVLTMKSVNRGLVQTSIHGRAWTDTLTHSHTGHIEVKWKSPDQRQSTCFSVGRPTLTFADPYFTPCRFCFLGVYLFFHNGLCFADNS